MSQVNHQKVTLANFYEQFWLSTFTISKFNSKANSGILGMNKIVAKSLEILSNILVKRCKSRHKNYADYYWKGNSVTFVKRRDPHPPVTVSWMNNYCHWKELDTLGNHNLKAHSLLHSRPHMQDPMLIEMPAKQAFGKNNLKNPNKQFLSTKVCKTPNFLDLNKNWTKMGFIFFGSQDWI